MQALKPLVVGVWIAALAAMLFGSGRIAVIGHLVFWLTAVAHVVEFLAKRRLFERVGGSMGHHFVQTLVFGLFHWRPLEEQLAAGAAPGGSAGPDGSAPPHGSERGAAAQEPARNEADR